MNYKNLPYKDKISLLCKWFMKSNFSKEQIYRVKQNKNTIGDVAHNIVVQFERVTNYDKIIFVDNDYIAVTKLVSDYIAKNNL